MTGAQKWKAGNDEGCITFADGMLYTLDQRGTIRLVRATPEKYEVAGEFRVPSGGKGMYWAHPKEFINLSLQSCYTPKLVPIFLACITSGLSGSTSLSFPATSVRGIDTISLSLRATILPKSL